MKNFVITMMMSYFKAAMQDCKQHDAAENYSSFSWYSWKR